MNRNRAACAAGGCTWVATCAGTPTDCGAFPDRRTCELQLGSHWSVCQDYDCL